MNPNRLPLEPVATPGSLLVLLFVVGLATIIFLEIRERLRSRK